VQGRKKDGKSRILTSGQGRIQGVGWVWVSKYPLFWEIFFNLLGFFKKKNAKTPPKFSRLQKKTFKT